MNEDTTPKLDSKINRFAKSLKKDFAPEIAKDPGAFRATVLGKLKPKLPRRRPGRQGSPEVKQASELYLSLYASKGVPGNWNEIAKRLVPGYASLSADMQRYHRYRLRSQTHSYLYDQRSRLRRSRPRHAS